MSSAARLAVAVALAGVIAFAFTRWVRPDSVLELVAALSLCR